VIIIAILGGEKTVTPVARTVGHALRASTVATVPVITAKHATHVARIVGHVGSIVEMGYVTTAKTAIHAVKTAANVFPNVIRHPN
jgi:hypothetical protein